MAVFSTLCFCNNNGTSPWDRRIFITCAGGALRRREQTRLREGCLSRGVLDITCEKSLRFLYLPNQYKDIQPCETMSRCRCFCYCWSRKKGKKKKVSPSCLTLTVVPQRSRTCGCRARQMKHFPKPSNWSCLILHPSGEDGKRTVAVVKRFPLPGPLWAILRFSVLPKNTSTWRRSELGFELPTLQTLDSLLRNQLKLRKKEKSHSKWIDQIFNCWCCYSSLPRFCRETKLLPFAFREIHMRKKHQ